VSCALKLPDTAMATKDKAKEFKSFHGDIFSTVKLISFKLIYNIFNNKFLSLSFIYQ
jgi:hypothetical protein